ncbi:hypothetical protein BV22DRAFT_1186621, partial [Leucogyrophana mollusca]
MWKVILGSNTVYKQLLAVLIAVEGWPASGPYTVIAYEGFLRRPTLILLSRGVLSIMANSCAYTLENNDSDHVCSGSVSLHLVWTRAGGGGGSTGWGVVGVSGSYFLFVKFSGNLKGIFGNSEEFLKISLSRIPCAPLGFYYITVWFAQLQQRMMRYLRKLLRTPAAAATVTPLRKGAAAFNWLAHPRLLPKRLAHGQAFSASYEVPYTRGTALFAVATDWGENSGIDCKCVTGHVS